MTFPFLPDSYKLMSSSDSNWHVHNYVRCISNYLVLNYASSFICKPYPRKITPFSKIKYILRQIYRILLSTHTFKTYYLKGDISKQLTLAKTIPLFSSRKYSRITSPKHLNSNALHLIYNAFEMQILWFSDFIFNRFTFLFGTYFKSTNNLKFKMES